MTPAYKRIIKYEYDRLAAESELSPGLFNPTTKTLKEECLKKLKSGLKKEDIRVLMDFFKETNPDHLEKKINNCDPDDLKSVWKFVKGETELPGYKVVELVATLIAYPHRPYSPKLDYQLVNTPSISTRLLVKPISNEEVATEGTSIEGPDNAPAPEPIPEPHVTRRRLIGSISPTHFTVAFAFLTIVGLLLYNLGKRPGIQSSLFIAESCMYWAVDRYEPSSCDNKIEGVFLIALDSFKLNNFRRVTIPDTITYASIGRLWYYKPKRDSVEFFTAEGFHPTMYSRRLKPLTKYMIDVHVFGKRRVDSEDGKP